jgi:hypothetical protein
MVDNRATDTTVEEVEAAIHGLNKALDKFIVDYHDDELFMEKLKGNVLTLLTVVQTLRENKQARIIADMKDVGK